MPPSGWFTDRSPTEAADSEDLTHLLDNLSRHYSDSPGLLNDFDEIAAENLVEIFAAMDMYYTIGDGFDHEEAGTLWALFDYLGQIFG